MKTRKKKMKKKMMRMIKTLQDLRMLHFLQIGPKGILHKGTEIETETDLADSRLEFLGHPIIAL